MSETCFTTPTGRKLGGFGQSFTTGRKTVNKRVAALFAQGFGL
jgi:hypothetical protein